MNTRFLSFGLMLGLCVPALAQLSPGNPLVGLEKLKDFEAMRASSSDPDWRNGNADSRPIEPGGTLVLADVRGPGNLHSAQVKLQAENWGAHKLSAGPHVLRLECKGKSDNSTGYFLGVDSIAAVVPVYERPPGFDLRKIQK